MDMDKIWFYLNVYSDDWTVSAASLFTVMSCALLINHMPWKRRWLEKMLLGTIALGAFGMFVTPLCGIFRRPTDFEVLFVCGVATFSVWLTWPYWRELPGLDRRKRAHHCYTEDSTGFNRRGVSTEEDEGLLRAGH